jgi:hypothetical protein
MSDLPSDELRDLGFLRSSPPAPPSPALLAALSDLEAVRTRVPVRTLLLVAAAACVYPVTALGLYPLRKDLDALPFAWLITVALVWLAGFAVPLVLAVLPRKGQVLPDAAAAGRSAFLSISTLILLGLLFTVDAPGRTILPRSTWAGFFPLWWHCVSFGLKVSIPSVLVCGFAFRRLRAVNLWRLGAAIGAAGGALAGLTLHGLCPFGGAAHVGLAHGGGVLVGALLGALWMPLLARVDRATHPSPAA